MAETKSKKKKKKKEIKTKEFEKGAGGDKAGTLKSSTLKSMIFKKARKDTKTAINKHLKAKKAALKKYIETSEGLSASSPYREEAGEVYDKEKEAAVNKWSKKHSDPRDAASKDWSLVEEYGPHAPKARSFMSKRKASGGTVKNYANGGGVRKAKFIDS